MLRSGPASRPQARGCVRVIPPALILVVLLPGAARSGDEDEEDEDGPVHVEDVDKEIEEEERCDLKNYRRKKREDGSVELIVPPECPLPPLPGEEPSEEGKRSERRRRKVRPGLGEKQPTPPAHEGRPTERPDPTAGDWKSTLSDDGSAVIGVGPAKVDMDTPSGPAKITAGRPRFGSDRASGSGVQMVLAEGTAAVVFDADVVLGTEYANLRPAQRARARPEPPPVGTEEEDLSIDSNLSGDRRTSFLRGYARLGVGLELGLVAARLEIETGGGGTVGLGNWGGEQDDRALALRSGFLEGRWPSTGLSARAGLVPWRDGLDGMLLDDELAGLVVRWDLVPVFDTDLIVDLFYFKLAEWIADGADDVSWAGLDLVYGDTEADHFGFHFYWLGDRHGDNNVQIQKGDDLYIGVTGSLRWSFLGVRADAAMDYGKRTPGADNSSTIGDSYTTGFFARLVIDSELGPVTPLLDVLYSSGETRIDAEARNEFHVAGPRRARRGALSRLELLTLNNDEYGWLSLARAPSRPDVISELATTPRPLTLNNNDRGLTAVAVALDYQPVGEKGALGWESFTVSAILAHALSSTRKDRSLGTEIKLGLSLEPVRGLLIEGVGAVLLPGSGLDNHVNDKERNFIDMSSTAKTTSPLYKVALRARLQI